MSKRPIALGNSPKHRSPHDAHHLSASQASPFAPAATDLVQVGSRRWFLQAGISGVMGLSLPTLLRNRVEAAGTQKEKRPTSVIQIWLSGGPSQIDTWDMKPEMPPEIRGPFSPISTCVPGIDVCEYLPKLASIMDKLTIIRSVDASASNHTPITFQACNPKARRTNDGKD